MNILIEFCKGLNNYLGNKPKYVSIAWGVILFILISGIDYQVKPEISLSIFYLLPISLITWFVRKEAGFVACILSAIAWFITNPNIQQTESGFLVPYWNASVSLIFFFAVAYLLSKWRYALEQEKEFARIDSTTAVANKRLFLELARLELKKAQRYRHPLTIVYIDIDDFKNINDNWGKKIGDQLLQIAAETIKQNIRETDIIGRLGGDEFAIILPGSGYEPANIVTCRVQRELLDAMQKNEWCATFSMGAVTFVNPPNSVDEMIHKVDRLVYLIKHNGKNQLNHKASI
jgi:diguanylate cyclase (GGDEF)-like protein